MCEQYVLNSSICVVTNPNLLNLRSIPVWMKRPEQLENTQGLQNLVYTTGRTINDGRTAAYYTQYAPILMIWDGVSRTPDDRNEQAPYSRPSRPDLEHNLNFVIDILPYTVLFFIWPWAVHFDLLKLQVISF